VDEHEKNLKRILRIKPEEFSKWVASLTDEELIYVEWLLEKAETSLDQILIEQSGLFDARVLLEKVQNGVK
jgi:hypothetical protein